MSEGGRTGASCSAQTMRVWVDITDASHVVFFFFRVSAAKRDDVKLMVRVGLFEVIEQHALRFI